MLRECANKKKKKIEFWKKDFNSAPNILFYFSIVLIMPCQSQPSTIIALPQLDMVTICFPALKIVINIFKQCSRNPALLKFILHLI